MLYVEQNCDFTHAGKTFTSGGAVVTHDFIVGYTGKVVDGVREITDWHGKRIGTMRITSTWATPRSYVSSTMHQAYATVDGVRYTGRTAGEGMIFKGRKVAH